MGLIRSPQRVSQLLQGPIGSVPEWAILQRIAEACGAAVLPNTVADERSLFRHMVASLPALEGLSMVNIGETGISLEELQSARNSGSSVEEVRA